MSAAVTAPAARYPLAGEDRAIAYIEWRLACIAVWTAYREWTRAMRADAALAHAAYEAALDREDAAATAYARLMKLMDVPRHSRVADSVSVPMVFLHVGQRSSNAPPPGLRG